MSGASSGVGSGLRPLRTRRPFTPREPQRTLFTERARKKDPRPPSAFDGVGSGLRPLRTRRPFTPREPQRTLFTERARKKDPRPPSAFDLKHLSLSESGEDAYLADVLGAVVDPLDEHTLNGILNADAKNAKKKPPLRNQPRSVQERSGDGWSNFPKLPHLSGHSKPLHKRNTTGQAAEDSKEDGLSQAISVIRPLGSTDDENTSTGEISTSKSLSPDSKSKRKHYSSGRSLSYDVSPTSLGNIGVKHLAVQLPNTTPGQYENMTVLELSEALSQRTIDVNRTVSLLEILQSILEKNTPGNSLRELVLRALYTHVDSEDERVLVAIARAMLTMRVTGPHLAAACKLVFKIARNDKNDHFFHNTNLLGNGRSLSYDVSSTSLGNIGVKHLAVQLPNTTPGQYENMTILELSEALSQRTSDVNRTISLLEILQSILEKNTPGNSLRELVLRALYTHVDSEDERVLVAIARVMLTMRVTGPHLAAACKLVFKIARNDKNDHFFHNTNLLELLVEGCGRADPVSEGECCVYGAGALRFLALDPALCALAHRAGAVHLAALHLKILNTAVRLD
ncbi:hypothetical protein O3G_MSEX015280 [Manduca sexta]|uniref:Uncharacterized protein n=1 Tax=Manduca sexta TaxID=7130 RepID=A0A922A1E7_MANSE|nr:hypothetical protein O3G_MSEX015280 [Manduca sexta]